MKIMTALSTPVIQDQFFRPFFAQHNMSIDLTVELETTKIDAKSFIVTHPDSGLVGRGRLEDIALVQLLERMVTTHHQLYDKLVKKGGGVPVHMILADMILTPNQFSQWQSLGKLFWSYRPYNPKWSKPAMVVHDNEWPEWCGECGWAAVSCYTKTMTPDVRNKLRMANGFANWTFCLNPLCMHRDGAGWTKIMPSWIRGN